MRCKFCGYINPEGKDKCEKCNKPLEKSSENQNNMASANNSDRPTERQANQFNPKATLPEYAVKQQMNGAENVCPLCGYALDSDGNCSSCGYSANGRAEIRQEVVKPINQGRMTMRPIRKGEKEGRFVLTPISEENGLPEADPLVFEGNEISLNRDNTDSKNPTITSQTQAVISCENGKWSIIDKSEYKTTFVQAGTSIDLDNGSLILLGNQLYKFDLLK